MTLRLTSPGSMRSKAWFSFMRNGTLPVLVGKPPADVAQLARHERDYGDRSDECRTGSERAENSHRLCQNPRNNSSTNDHSDTSRTQPALRMPNTGYIQKSNRLLLI